MLQSQESGADSSNAVSVDFLMPLITADAKYANACTETLQSDRRNIDFCAATMSYLTSHSSSLERERERERAHNKALYRTFRILKSRLFASGTAEKCCVRLSAP